MSQAELAKRLHAIGLADCKRSRLSGLEAGYADAEWSEVEPLAKALDVIAQWLAGIDDVAAAAVLLVSAPLPSAVAEAPSLVGPAEAAQVNGPHRDLAALDRGAHRNDYDFRHHLAAMFNRARADLHEAGLPAADWKHWRMVERKAMDELRRCT